MKLHGNYLKHKFNLLVPFLLFTVFYLTVFTMLENVNVYKFYNPHMKLDLYIPFVKYFIVPYILWFLWIPFVCLTLLFTDEEEYIRSKRSLIFGMTAFLVISAAFPTKIYLRPQKLVGDDIFIRLTAMIYNADTPTNVFPSIHVYNTLVLCFSVFNSKCRLFKNTAFRIFTVILSVLICLSTLFMRQHSVMDMLGAFILFAISETILMLREHRMEEPFKKGIPENTVS